LAHINLKNDQPGISGLMTDYPDTATHLRALANELLRANESLTPAEREMIAAYVSSGNQCRFCTLSHAAVARAHLGEERAIIDDVLNDVEAARVSEKMRALLAIADKVRRDGRTVSGSDVEGARGAGADDRAIHDTVLIAAAFCMYNRYVDGLGTWAPDGPEAYQNIGEQIAKHGYGKA
jgi:uncharacterized peroxidase-related enzyme